MQVIQQGPSATFDGFSAEKQDNTILNDSLFGNWTVNSKELLIPRKDIIKPMFRGGSISWFWFSADIKTQIVIAGLINQSPMFARNLSKEQIELINKNFSIRRLNELGDDLKDLFVYFEDSKKATNIFNGNIAKIQKLGLNK